MMVSSSAFRARQTRLRVGELRLGARDVLRAASRSRAASAPALDELLGALRFAPGHRPADSRPSAPPTRPTARVLERARLDAASSARLLTACASDGDLEHRAADLGAHGRLTSRLQLARDDRAHDHRVGGHRHDVLRPDLHGRRGAASRFSRFCLHTSRE